MSPRTASRSLVVLTLAVLPGCATAFRDAKSEVRFSSSPPGANVTVRGRGAGVTPAVVEVPRTGSTDIVIESPGREPHRGSVRKSMNAGWLTADVLTCVFPVALCIPLLVDAITGAWVDVEPSYDVTLPPSRPGAPAPTAPGSSGPAPSSVPSGTGPELSL